MLGSLRVWTARARLWSALIDEPTIYSMSSPALLKPAFIAGVTRMAGCCAPMGARTFALKW